MPGFLEHIFSSPEPSDVPLLFYSIHSALHELTLTPRTHQDKQHSFSPTTTRTTKGTALFALANQKTKHTNHHVRKAPHHRLQRIRRTSFFSCRFTPAFQVGSTKGVPLYVENHGAATTKRFFRLLTNLSSPSSVGHTLSIGAMESLL